MNDSDYSPLRVVVKSDEVPNMYTRDKGRQHEQVIGVRLEEVRRVLNDEFNPPLQCATQGKEVRTQKHSVFISSMRLVQSWEIR